MAKGVLVHNVTDSSQAEFTNILVKQVSKIALVSNELKLKLSKQLFAALQIPQKMIH